MCLECCTVNTFATNFMGYKSMTNHVPRLSPYPRIVSAKHNDADHFSQLNVLNQKYKYFYYLTSYAGDIFVADVS